MMEKANIVHIEALKKLDKNREKQEKIGTTLHKLSIYSQSRQVTSKSTCLDRN